jgi:hypothetical protein
MRIALVVASWLAAAPASASASQVTLEVTTAAASEAWHDGRSSPFVVRVTGIGRATVRVDCWGTANSYVRAHDVRNGVAMPAVSDFPPRTIPKPEELRCTAYRGDVWVASWSGVLAWPKTTLPDHRITKLTASRCGTQWCVDVVLDRSHPGTRRADVEVLCTLRHASTDRFVIETAPSSRKQLDTKQERVRLKLDNAPGASVITCSVDRGLYNNARFADTDATNNELSTTVANTATTKAKLAFVKADGAATAHLGCGSCSTYVPGALVLATRIRNTGSEAVTGVGVRCEATANGTLFQLRGASGAIAAGETRDISVSIQLSSAVMTKLVGAIKTRCDVVVWDQPAGGSTVGWTGTVVFPKL